MEHQMREPDQAEEKETRHIGSREFYTVAQLADLLQLNEMTIYRMVKTGDLPCHLIGRIMRFRHNDIEEFLKQHRVPARKRKV
jgi:excisionase family DNA binding protein